MSAATWIVDALIASTLLMAAVLVVRGPVRRAFGPQVGYALWALPALRLLLPPLPAGWWHGAATAAAAPITRAGETVTIYFTAPTASVDAVATGPSLGLMLGLAWAAGAVAFLGWHVARHRRFVRAVLAAARPIEEHDGIRVVASAAAPGPLAFGVRDRVVAFPADFAERYDADERALALQHELGHHARRDLLANWAALAVLALHWFSPIAWAAFRAFRADQELANDAGVLARCGVHARHAYGRAIVKAAGAGAAVSATCHLHSIADLKGRLRMMTSSRASRRRLATGSAAVTLLAAAGLGLTASSSAAERIGATLQAPAAPAAPMPPADAGPDAPPPPPGPTGPGSGGRHVEATRTSRAVHVVVSENGRTQHFEGAAAERYLADHAVPVPPVPPAPPAPPAAMAAPGAPSAPPRVVIMRRGGRADRVAWQMNVPQVSNGRCPGDNARPMIETRTENGRQSFVICTNRITAMQRDAQDDALHAEAMARVGTMNARVGLTMARSAIEHDRNLSAEQRAQALAGIAQAEAELRDPANN